MNRLATRVLVIAFAFFCLAGPLRAQADGNADVQSNLPIIPMTVRFQFVPQYFVQLLGNDRRYGSIEALIDSSPERPWYEVILTDKTTGRRIFYLNSPEAVNSLRQMGTIAHYAEIEFAVLGKTDPSPTYRIGLRDSFNQEISWKFIVNPRVTDAETRFLSPPGASGFVVMHAIRRSAAARGTTVTIGDVTSAADVPEPSGTAQNSVPYNAFYAMGLVIAEIAPGTQFWTVYSIPAQLKEGETWILRRRGGQQRTSVIERVSGNQMQIRQVDQDNPFSPPAKLDVVRLDNGFALRSISFEQQSHTFRISFEPELPLPSRGAVSKTNIGFVIAEDNQPSIAAGKAVVLRAIDAEHVLWQFQAPNWARTNAFDTGVNVIR